MKKKVLVFVAVACICLFSFDNAKAYQQVEEMASDDRVVWGLGSQYWKRVNKMLCCDSSHETPCRQSSSSC